MIQICMPFNSRRLENKGERYEKGTHGPCLPMVKIRNSIGSLRRLVA